MISVMRISHIRPVIATVVVSLTLLGCAGAPTSNGVARDFVAMTTAGDEISGDSIRGNVTIVDFWAVF
jgi:hypothetical protein